MTTKTTNLKLDVTSIDVLGWWRSVGGVQVGTAPETLSLDSVQSSPVQSGWSVPETFSRCNNFFCLKHFRGKRYRREERNIVLGRCVHL